MTDLSQAADVVKRLRNTAVVMSKVPFGPITAALLNEAADLIEALLAERVSAETMAWAQQEADRVDATERPDAESLEELPVFRRRIERDAVIDECASVADSWVQTCENCAKNAKADGDAGGALQHQLCADAVRDAAMTIRALKSKEPT